MDSKTKQLDEIYSMAREAGFADGVVDIFGLAGFAIFAALVRADEREKVARWMREHGYATGHGDTTEDLLKELDWQIAENWTRTLIDGVTGEREECAKVCEAGVVQTSDWDASYWNQACENRAAAIRARGEK